MSRDNVGLVSLAFSKLVARRDPEAAAVIKAQAERLRADSNEARALEARLLEATAARSQFWFGSHEFRTNLLVIGVARGRYMWCYDDDIVSLADRPEAGRDPWDENVTGPQWFRDAARAGAPILRAHLLLHGAIERFEERAGGAGSLAPFTHLTVQPQECRPSRALRGVFPNLRGLWAYQNDLATLLEGGAPRLEALRVNPELPFSLASLLRTLAASRLDSLRHLGVYHASLRPTEIDELAADPMLARLSTLDLFTYPAAGFPFQALLAHRRELAHLERLVVPGHALRAGIRAQFEDWPAVTFGSHDRRELIAFDFETTGWPDGAR